MIKKHIKKISAFAPGTSANLIVGFDTVGFPVSQVGDEVSLALRADSEIVIQSISANESLPLEPNKNTATVALMKMLDALNLSCGFDVEIKKGIPLSSGLGGSAASACASLTALNALLEVPLTNDYLIEFALDAEKIASGERHADNVAPCLWGEMTLVYSLKPLELVILPMPEVYSVLVHPEYQIPTKLAREALAKEVTFSQHIKQLSRFGSFISALYQHDLSLLSACAIDDIVEPQRAKLLPGFYDVKTSALTSGALMASFSGAGPTMFALCKDEKIAVDVALNMQNAFSNHGLKSESWIEKMAPCRPQIIDVVEN